MFTIFGSVVLQVSNNSPADVIVVVGDIEFVGTGLVEIFSEAWLKKIIFISSFESVVETWLLHLGMTSFLERSFHYVWKLRSICCVIMFPPTIITVVTLCFSTPSWCGMLLVVASCVFWGLVLRSGRLVLFGWNWWRYLCGVNGVWPDLVSVKCCFGLRYSLLSKFSSYVSSHFVFLSTFLEISFLPSCFLRSMNFWVWWGCFLQSRFLESSAFLDRLPGIARYGCVRVF